MNALARILSPRRITLLVAVLLVISGGGVLLRDRGSTSLTATFASGEGLYVGDDVKVLGVKVGKVTAVRPTEDGVVVSMAVDSGQPIPRDARAAIVSPSLVSGRFVQLTPVWTSGPRLGDGDAIPESRTAVPVSFDSVKEQLIDLTSALGPQGTRRGSLAVAIDAIDKSLRHGRSTELRRAITELRAAAGSLSDGRSDLFSTISNLDSFTRNLAINDAAVRGFTQQLSAAGGVHASNRQDLTGLMHDLATVLRTTRTFFQHHRARLTRSLRDLNTTASTVASRSNELAGVLHVAPHSLVDLYNVIDSQAITARVALSGFDDVPQLVCGAILGGGGSAEQCRTALQPLLSLLGLTRLHLPAIGTSATTPGAATAPAAGAGGGAPLTGVTGSVQGLLSGLLGSKGGAR